MVNKCRIAIIDKSPIFSIGVVQTIRRDRRLIIVAQGTTVADSERIISENEPDVLLLDASVSGSLGVIQAVGLAQRNTKVLLLASTEDLEHAAAALRAGAHGYITRRVAGPVLVKAIVAIYGGERYVTPELAWHLAKNFAMPPAQHKVANMPQLSIREHQVLDFITSGLSNLEIAGRLDLGLSTVKLYKTIAFRKLGVRNRLEAIAAMNTSASAN
jgi:DNA-binding NarL/FixJ family response regulator